MFSSEQDEHVFEETEEPEAPAPEEAQAPGELPVEAVEEVGWPSFEDAAEPAEPAFEAAEAPDQPVFEAAGPSVHEVFLGYWERFGEEVLGAPIAGAVEENGVVTQYFEHVALEAPAPGDVRFKPLGRDVLRLREQLHTPRPMVVRPPIIDVVYDLTRHADRHYESRTLAQIRQLVIHHTAADPTLSVEAVAAKHVQELGWPGIGYHFVIEADGRIFQTNDLTTVSFHARQANPTTVGIAFCGNFDHTVPAAPQIESGGALCAYLLRELSLPVENVRGHSALVATECPGTNWTEGAGWRETLMEHIRRASSGT